MQTIPTITGRKEGSLGEVHSSISTTHAGFFRRVLAFSGPAYLVSVGYMDPGNWATDLEAGSRFGYRLLWVIVVSNLLAILLQTLSARLGIVTGRDLAQACRESYPKSISVALWALSEIAIVACDLAEVLGAAIALHLLFHIPLLAGVLVTAFDTLLLLWLQRYGIRIVEALVIALIGTIGVCFTIEIFFAKPDLVPLAAGLIPRINSTSLYAAVAIIGATIMPHNLFLHSSLVQTRRIGKSEPELRQACRYNLIDSAVALNGAMFVNLAILVLSAAVFFRAGKVVTDIEQAYQLLTPLLGAGVASALFGIALLCSGQSSTITGTMAGQIVMEGFLDIRIRPWLRRLLTRTLAVIPAAFVVYSAGAAGTFKLLLLSQVILSLQLPFAVVPLLHLTSDRSRMGPFVSGVWLRAGGWLSAAFIIGLNVWAISQPLAEMWESTGPALRFIAILFSAGLMGLLAYLTFAPVWAHWRRRSPELLGAGQVEAGVLKTPDYNRILVTLDHSSLDRQAVAHAAALARAHHAILYLLHVEEGVTSQVYGSESSTAEVEAGRDYLDRLVESLRSDDLQVETAIRHSSQPNREIVAYAREIEPDLIVMGAHGHGGIKDLIYGNTIDPVRHQVDVPILVVRAPIGSRRKK